MAISYTDIIEAIDAAILKWAGRPMTIINGDQTWVCRTMDDLLKARNHYEKLATAQAREGRPFNIVIIKCGGPR